MFISNEHSLKPHLWCVPIVTVSCLFCLICLYSAKGFHICQFTIMNIFLNIFFNQRWCINLVCCDLLIFFLLITLIFYLIYETSFFLSFVTKCHHGSLCYIGENWLRNHVDPHSTVFCAFTTWLARTWAALLASIGQWVNKTWSKLRHKKVHIPRRPP